MDRVKIALRHLRSLCRAKKNLRAFFQHPLNLGHWSSNEHLSPAYTVCQTVTR